MAEIEIVQADREAAADLIAWHNTAASEWRLEGGADLSFFAANMPDGIRRGIWDEHEVVHAFARHRLAPTGDEYGRGKSERMREALTNCVGALQFILSFYEPGQRHLDTEAWKGACASGVRAYMNGAALIDWCIRPMRADNGVVYFDKASQRHD